MKKKLILPLLLMLVFTLSACGPDPGGKPSPPPESNSPHEETQIGPPHQDAGGLAEVLLEDGGASIVLYPEKWPDLSEVFGDDNVYLGEAGQGLTFRVNNLSGKVKDACIGVLPWFFESNPYTPTCMPMVIFLMEDGSLEWTLADPYWLVTETVYGYDEVAYSWGTLPWITDISSLSYERQKEGKGEMTMVATDTAGLRYDLMYPLTLQNMLWTVWRCDLSTEEGQFMNLELDAEGNATLEKGWGMSIDEVYSGSYKMYLAEDGIQGQRAGTIAFHLKRDMERSSEVPGSPMKMEGSYFVALDGSGSYYSDAEDAWTLRLWPAEGDALHSENGKALDEYLFYYDPEEGAPIDFGEATDEELVDYLLSIVPEAKRLVEEQGMSVLVTGETTEFENATICRDIWLGTNRPDSFVREILYTVSPWGEIFQYDPIGDGWNYP